MWRSELYLGALRWKRNPRRENTLYLRARREREEGECFKFKLLLKRGREKTKQSYHHCYSALHQGRERNLPLSSLVGSDS